MAPAPSLAVAAAAPVVIGGGLINIVVTDVLNDLTVDVAVTNNNVAVQVCAIVDLLSAQLIGSDLTCDIQQAQRRGGGGGGGGATTQAGPTAAAPVVIIPGGLVNIVITDVLNNVNISVDVSNNNVAVQVCAAVTALSTSLGLPDLTCTITQ